MGIGMAGVAADLILKAIAMVGDARAWGILVRLWAYHQVGTGDRPAIEDLEAWVHSVGRHLGVFAGQSRETLRMRCYEIAQGDRDKAAELYEWAVQGEGEGRLLEAPAEPEPTRLEEKRVHRVSRRAVRAAVVKGNRRAKAAAARRKIR